MASNRLEDLNDILFNQLVRLDDDEISDERLNKEIARAGAISTVGKTIIDNANTELNAAKFYDRREGSDTKLPEVFSDGTRKK